MLIATYLELSNVGPFLGREVITLEPECTVVTGPNDVGKSWILKAFEHFVLGTPLQELDVNLQYLKTDSSNWDTDRNISITVGFHTDGENLIELNAKGSSIHFGKGREEQFKVEYFAAPGVNAYQLEFGGARHVLTGRNPLIELVRLNPSAELNDVLSIGYDDEVSSLTQQLLDYVFGESGRFQVILRSLKHHHVRSSRIEAANRQLERLFNEIFPTFKQRLRFVEISSNAFRLDVTEGEDSTPLIYRSAGLKKFLSYRLQVHFSTNSVRPLRMVLSDEPELSLHADAQHYLRASFEQMCRSGRMQMMYVTHSPSMLNRLRPSTVRVVRRENKRHQIGLNLAHSRVEHHRPGDNFTLVRNCLGLSAADSLLYGPIVVVVEGDTELLCLDRILPILAKTPEELAALEMTVFMDGQGAPNLVHWCHRVETFGDTVIAFVDGDKCKDIERECRKHAYSFPVVFLDDGEEFEDLISREYYFQCLKRVCEKELTQEAFETWSAEQPAWFHRKVFTKRIDDWMGDTLPDLRFSKQSVMKEAVRSDPNLEKWKMDPLRLLLAEILKAARVKLLLPCFDDEQIT